MKLQMSFRPPQFINYKHKVYALFQFSSMAVWVFVAITISIFVGAYLNTEFDLEKAIDVDGKEKIVNQTVHIGKLLSFQYSSTDTHTLGFLIYFDAILLIINWGFGALIFRFKNRNLFDIMFLLFFVIPFLSNVIALFAQITKISALREAEFNPDDVYSKT